MKKILVYAPRNYQGEASFRIRLLALTSPLARRGYELVWGVRPGHPWGRMQLARSARDYDGVILHRKMLDPYETRILRRNARAKIILDIDDATMIHETALSPWTRRRLHRRFAATARILDTVCAGNSYLAHMFEEHHVPTTIVPSGVDPGDYALKQHGEMGPIRLVWIGSHSTVKYLEESLPALQAARRQIPDLRLIVICDVPPAAPGLPMEFIPWSRAGEAAALLQGDIGIAPTPENPWTRGKCGFKIVQYMAVGLPVIASPVGFNADLVHPAAGAAAGLLPGAWADWPAAIEKLARNSGLRGQLGAAGRARVETDLSLEVVADRWARVLEAPAS